MKILDIQSGYKILIAGLCLIVVTNVVALAGVAYNRSGEPDATIELTERELGMPYRYRWTKENTGLALQIKCRVEDRNQRYFFGQTGCRGYPDWLNQTKLAELGFNIKPELETLKQYARYKRALARDVYLVLEYNGPAYLRALSHKQDVLNEAQALLANNPDTEEFKERFRKARENLELEQHSNSSLFAIDAGQDKTALRNAYPDNSRYIILKASIRPSWRSEKTNHEWTGFISSLLINKINIPLAHRAIFAPIEDQEYRTKRGKNPPRYKVRIAFGKRSEPWVMGVEAL